MKERHLNIPIFIPHMGCPNACVFCNQRSISGTQCFDASTVEREIEKALTTVREGDTCEIAFFGGSFTGIDRALMVDLLERAQKYIDRGQVSHIRLSTRPDYINPEVLTILGRYGVKTVELGLQSMDDRVLLASGRGHDSRCALRACQLVREYGFELVGQMMIGLPLSDLGSEIMTAKQICDAGAQGARVYPTVVFRDTELARMTEKGSYLPLSTEDAVQRTASVLEIFEQRGVPCIRVGLCASESLSDEREVLGGANESAMGELAMNEVYFRRICGEIERRGFFGGSLTMMVSEGSISKAVGQKRKNAVRICEKYGFQRVKVLENHEIMGYNIILEHQPKTMADAQK